ncbi:MAG: bifunctional [glutamine synthetase] adenylyltransferase/[glutamine synthetase]-adenylyl-L-tyrosine phosphorylase [Alphaproteobacteria bacterium]
MPIPFDLQLMDRGRENWQAGLSGCDDSLRAEAGLDDPMVGGLIDGVLGTSPFLSGLLARRPQTALATLARGPEQPLAAMTGELSGTCDMGIESAVDESALMRQLRRAKQDVALIVALADLSGHWDLGQVTAALSDFADLCIRLCTDHLIAKYARRGAWAMPAGAPAHANFGLVTLAMGKLGAHELNYSSDIDLVLLFDSDAIDCDDSGNLSSIFNRFSKDLNRLIETRTADGYVFRADLRLRPDPGATPPVISLPAAESYYHSVGQTWERAAMIKARAVTGHAASIAATKAIIEPFVWRRHLDFWAIEDVHAVKKQIHAHKGGGRIAVAGHNVKLGRGGIREVEFFAQTQQLIWAGREPALRVPATVDALDALVEAGHVARPVADAMIAAYRHLRKVEHRLQMIDDRQTHSLPREPDELRRVACLMGEPDQAAFGTRLTGHLRTVHSHYADLFEESQLPSFGSNLVFTGTDFDPGTLETLTQLGYREPERVTELVRGWFAGRYRATRSERAQALMNRLVPELLQATGRTADPDAALVRFDRFLQGLPSGVQIFSLFAANPQLLTVVAEVMGSAPRLADYLAQHSGILDAMLGEGFFARLPDPDRLRAAFAARLAHAEDFEQMLDSARALTNDVKFRINLQLLRGTQPVESATAALADLAEAAIAALLPAVETVFAARYGTIERGAFAVLALGRLGSREMTARSDLDLVFIYDAPEEATHSTGPKSIPVAQYYAQLGQRMIAALTAPTASGRLYDVDMRLRPSGNAGPVAVSLERFIDYHGQSAWTWEHMALTRARVVAAIDRPDRDLAQRLTAAVRSTLARPRDRGRLAIDVDDMRERLRKQFGSDDPWDVKQRAGGLVDIEFIAQFLQLAHAADDPDCLATSTIVALDRLAAIGAIEREDADTLRRAHSLWHAIQAVLRLTVEGKFDAEAASADQCAALARTSGAVDFPSLVAQMAVTGEQVQALYAATVGEPAAAGRAQAEPDETNKQGE